MFNSFSSTKCFNNLRCFLPKYGAKLIFLDNPNTLETNTHMSTRHTNSIDLFIHAYNASSSRHCHALFFINLSNFYILWNSFWCVDICIWSFTLTTHRANIMFNFIFKSTELASPNFRLTFSLLYRSIWVKCYTIHLWRIHVYFKFFNNRRVFSVFIRNNHFIIIIFRRFKNCFICILAYKNCQMEWFIISYDTRAIARSSWTILSVVRWIKLSFRSLLAPSSSCSPWNPNRIRARNIMKWNEIVLMRFSRP